jgi:cystine transport system substrate-binding protein
VSAKLKSDLESQQAQLQADAKAYDEEYTQLESKLSSLRTQIAESQAQISDLSSSKAAEEKRQADATAREKLRQWLNLNLVNQHHQSSQVHPLVQETQEGSPAPIMPDTPSGNSLTVSTTGIHQMVLMV